MYFFCLIIWDTPQEDTGRQRVSKIKNKNKFIIKSTISYDRQHIYSDKAL